MRSFKTWIRQFESEDSYIGDLAKDMRRDKEFPVTRDWRSMLRHLENKHACREAKEAFVSAYGIYKREEQA